VKNSLILILASLLSCVSLSANAGRVIDSVLLNGSSTTTVTAGSNVAVAIQVTTSGGGNNKHWKSTSYTLNGSTVCDSTPQPNITSSGTHIRTFDITAPSSNGSYTVSFKAHRKTNCDQGSASNSFSVDDGIVVGNLILSCDVVFPGSQPFAGSGSIDSSSNRPLCNGVDCSFENFTSVGAINLDTNLGSFPDTSGSWTFDDLEYNYYTSTPSGENYRLITSGGTTAIYISGSRVFKKGVGLNVPFTGTGNPSELLIVVDGDLKIEENSVVNGFIYVNGDVVLEKNITFNGAVSASGSFDVKEGGRYTFDPSMLDNFDPHGFCEPVEPALPIVNYHFDECAYTGANFEVIDQTGNYSGTAFNNVDTSNNGQIERFADISNGRHHIQTSVPLPASYSVSTWFKKPSSSINNDYFVLGAMQNGGDLLYLDRDNGWRWGVYDGAGSTDGTYSFASLDNNWHHLTLVYSGGQTQLYIDGIFKDTVARAPSGTLKYIGTSFDDINDSEPQGFRAPLDEFLIYDTALSESNILTIYNNQLAKKNYDGSERIATTCLAELALYRFEQTDFSTQIDDTSGNNNHGQNIFGGLSTADGKYCRGFESESWNNYNGITDAFRSSLDLDDDVGLQGTISFWFKSTINWSQGDERVLFDASRYTGNGGYWDKFFVLEIQQDGRLKFAFEDSADSKFTLVEPALNSRTADTWYYTTVTWDFTANIFAIYLDGELITQQSRSTNGTLGELIPIVFGDNSSNYTRSGYSSFPSPYSSRGDFDEVRIYNQVLSQSEIQVDMNDDAGCGSEVHHFEIDTKDQRGVTCQADEIVIKACADVSCSIRNPDAIDVVLSINNTVYKTVTVSGDSGTATSYSHTTVGNAALSLDQTYECTNTSTEPCDVNFSDSAFLFSAIPTQISGKLSDEGYNATTLTLQAIETDNNTGACIGIFPDGGDIPVNLSYSCDDGACSQVVALTNDVNTHNVTTTLASYPLRFNTDSTATFAINYPDAAKLSLNAQKDIEVEDSDGNKVIKDLSGVSNAFVERPFAFFINAIDNPKAIDYSGGVFKKAGEDFTVELSAVVWQSADDSNDDGVPDIGADLSNNAVTPGFGHESSAETAEVSYAKVAPSSGVLGDLTISDTFTFTNGMATDSTVSYAEVGIISFSANLKDNSYLGADDVQGHQPYVGRFTPAYFTQAVESHGKLNAYHYDTCNANTWVYSGQNRDRSGINVGAISYEQFLEPIITVTAFNLAGEITQNYTESGFMKLAASGISIPMPIEDDAAPRLFPDVPDEKVKISSNMVAGDDPIASDTNGAVTYTFNELDHFVYEHSKHSKLKAFPASIPFIVTDVEDGDQIKLYSGSDTSITVTEKVITSGVEIRFGRWLLENSYGPETSPLPVTMFSQHFNGDNYDDNNFINNAEESCLVPGIGTKVTSGNIGDVGLNLWDYRLVDLDSGDGLSPNDTSASFAEPTKSFSAGLYQWLLFSAPSVVGNNKQGSLELEYQVPPWLQYDWNNDTNFNNNPTAKLTFGIFRGNDRIIYQREIEK